MINSLPSINQGLSPLSGQAASNAKASTSQSADPGDSFLSQLMKSCQQGGKSSSGQDNSSSQSLLSMLDASNASAQSASMYSTGPASLFSSEL